MRPVRARPPEAYRGFGISTYADLGPALKGAELVVLAVKPQVMPAVLEALAAALGQQPG